MSQRHTDDYKRNVVAEVLRKNKEGVPLYKAVEEMGHTPITFRNWRKQFLTLPMSGRPVAKKPAEVTFHQTPKRKYTKKATVVRQAQATDRVAVFYCTPTQAAEIIRGL